MDQWIHSKFPSLPTVRHWVMENAKVDITQLNQWIEQHKLLSTLLLAFVVFIIGYKILSYRRRKFPPGPRGLPLLGYLPFLTRMPHLKLDQLRKKYGPVMQIFIGTRRVVVLGTYDVIKEALTTDAFYGRPLQSSFFSDGSELSEIFAGTKWKEQRKFMFHIIRDFGTKTTVLEENSTKEINNFVEMLMKKKGQPLRIRPLLVPSISNNISSLVFGRRFQYDDPERIRLDKAMQDIGIAASNILILNFVPGLAKLLKIFGWKYFKISRKALSWIKNFMETEIKSHKESLSDDSVNDYMDNFLVEMKRFSNNPDSTFKESVLVDILSSFFIGGSETSRSTLEWAFLTMAAFPEVQKRVFEEITDVIGKERFPLYTDIQKMPYTQAVLFEVMRWRSIAPFSVARTLFDTEVQGYFIPKNTLIFANMWATQRDPDNWLLPEVFRPERFLSEDGKEIIKPEKFFPFGIGKRICPGEALAKAQIFVYFASILQKMIVKPVPGVKMDFSEYIALSLCPADSELCFVPRE